MERPASLSAAAAMRQLRRRSQLCKHCAASIPQRSSVDSWQRLPRIGLSLLRRKNFLHERFETRVAAEIVKHWIDLNQKDIAASAFAVRSFDFVNRTLFVAQS